MEEQITPTRSRFSDVVTPDHDRADPASAHTHTSTTATSEEVSVDDSRWDMEEDPEFEELHAWNVRLRRKSVHVPLTLRAKDKRMSLPSLKSLWDDTRSRRNSSVSALEGERQEGEQDHGEELGENGRGQYRGKKVSL